MLDNIASSDAEIAKFLEITPQTLRKYRKKGQAPRLVMLALFWKTVWGQSAANCDAVNWGRLQYQENVMLKRKVERLERKLAELEQAFTEIDRAANSPIFEIR